MSKIISNVTFGKLFLHTLEAQVGENTLNITRQLFIARTNIVENGMEAIHIVTYSLDGKRVVLSVVVEEDKAEAFVQAFPTEDAENIAKKYCLMTFDQIQKESETTQPTTNDIDIPHVGVE